MYMARSAVDGYMSSGLIGERYAAPEFFGELPADKAVALKTQFQAKYRLLRDMIVIENSRSTHPVDANTLNANLASMDRVYAQVNDGAWDKAPALESTARGILKAVGMATPTVSVADVLRSVQDIPKQIKALLIEAARTSGEAAGALAKGAGLDPASTLETTSSTVKWVAGGAIALGVAYAISVFK